MDIYQIFKKFETQNPKTDYISVTAMDSNTFIVVYRDFNNAQYGAAVVGTISGTSISFGTEAVFTSGVSGYNSVTAINESTFVVAYEDYGNNRYGTAVVGTISGTSISFGSKSIFNLGDTGYNSMAAMNESTFVVAYEDYSNPKYLTAVVGTISGNSISFGTEAAFNSGKTWYNSVTAINESTFVVAYTDSSFSDYAITKVGTISGNAISFKEN